ncbi:MBL fold metallo-hydrolase [Amycolatopsis rhabdoformis]|uniref:MBL fold metallo-hydrolase n=1 Tax=Amycolatopsis rhabdoformis TaxID=1448059 RepID=A0ABZ1I7R6_9PSEU|nr:MBL fold metallo-hydrolase [Amycolatopsis rhabdoformis]WSE29913.1 MBL fold metallo-hydrolase [Amycolatopsis rhabdoformis]
MATTDFDRTRLTRVSPARSLRLGDLTITHVPDGLARLRPRGWLAGTTEADWAANADHVDEDGFLAAGIGALLVERGDRALLIDTGFGPESFPDDPANPLLGIIRGGDLVNSLRALGREPHQIEAVALTHLHGDHLGWSWGTEPGSDTPPFAHAPHFVAASEWARRDLAVASGVPEERLAAFAPLVHPTDDGTEIFPGVRLSLSSGHTAGHATYTITAGPHRLLAFGDAMHAPIQVTHPDWACGIDHDRVESEKSRRLLIEELSRPDTIGYGAHFADVVFGRAERLADGRFTWVPVV